MYNDIEGNIVVDLGTGTVSTWQQVLQLSTQQVLLAAELCST
jgi:hypothetical protein